MGLCQNLLSISYDVQVNVLGAIEIVIPDIGCMTFVWFVTTCVLPQDINIISTKSLSSVGK